MTNFTKKILTTVILIVAFYLGVNGQTNVSGGIYTNTTWTLANSPYIIVDTVVVFPGVTLTIQPGVQVKFNDSMRLENRQANIIAIGTITDSITFTSNSSSPSPGSWKEIFFNENISSIFKYCHFKYAKTAVFYLANGTNQILNIKNSTFDYNLNCLNVVNNNNSTSYVDSCSFRKNSAVVQTPTYLTKQLMMNHCSIVNNLLGLDFAYSTIENSIIDSNATGIKIHLNDNVLNCKIRYNAIGIQNQYISSTGGNIITGNEINNNVIGISLNINGDNFSSNQICNNTDYNLKYLYTGGNTDVSNNCWCSMDSSIISAKIYDGYDNFNYGLAHFMPLDTSQSCLIAGISASVFQNYSFDIFPNPTSDYLTVALPRSISSPVIEIFNMLGELEYSSTVTMQKTDIDVSGFTSGLHIIQIATTDNISRRKFIKK
ncbi:MAG: T9SS type A sorting domain-containing protein [Bacteroidota bacterium]